MGKKTKLAKGRLDKFYYLAKEQGYRSRAAFKLIQLNRKHDFLSGARTLLDLCAAPGGWLQVAVKNMPIGSLILGVDLVPIKAVRGCKTLIGDITTQKCRQQIIKESSGALMDVVLCDGAPNIGGAWTSEAYSQVWLALEALKLATDVLAPKGTFVTKVFRSKDYSALMFALKQLFDKVEATKPAASRNSSAEIFVVCRGYKAPSKIDPRLLDAKYLFGDLIEVPKSMGPDALLKQKVKQRRFREGYEEGLSTTHKAVSAVGFVMGTSPVEMLGQYTVISLEEGGGGAGGGEEDTDGSMTRFVLEHKATTDEVKILCKDLQVLGRSEFKQLLKWRLTIKRDLEKYLASQKDTEADDADKTANSDDDSDAELDPEERLLQEMSDIKDRLERRRKREKKRRRELKTKARVRVAQLAAAQGIGEDDGPEGLFTIKDLKGGRSAKVTEADVPSFEDHEILSTDSDLSSRSDSDNDSDIDSDEERRRYDATMEQYLEESFRSWKERQRMRDAGGFVKKKRRRLGMDGDLDSDDDDNVTTKGADAPGFGDSSEEEDNEDDEDNEGGSSEEEEEEDLLVDLEAGKKLPKKAREAAAADMWFSQDVFGDDIDVESDDDDDEEDVKPVAKKQKAKTAVVGATAVDNNDGKKQKKNNKKEKAVPAAAPPSDQEDDEDALPVGKKAQRKALLSKPSTVNNNNNFSARDGGVGFEVVALEKDKDYSDDSDSSEDEFEGLDDNAKAEVLALARKMLRRKDKTDLMEAAYNRYAFHDDKLPKWFAEDEHKFMRPAPQITAEEYKAAKDELRAIDARPIKKVAEAKARKRKRLVSKLQQARSKAESIANEEYVPAGAKMREIEKVYARARASVGGNKGKGKGKKGGRDDKGGGGGFRKGGGRPLDRRLLSDKRGLDAAARRNKGRGGKGGRKK